MYAHVHEQLPDPRKRAAMPDECVAILQRATAKEAADRYPTVAAMREALDQLLAEAPEIENRFLLADTSVTWSGEGTPVSTTPPRSRPGNTRATRSSSTKNTLRAHRLLLPLALVTLARRRRRQRAGVEGAARGLQGEHAAGGGRARRPAHPHRHHPLDVGHDGLQRAAGPRRHAARHPRDQQQGRRARPLIDPVIADGRSDWPTFAKEAERLISDEKVVTLFGGWTSASRKSMRPVVERHDHLLIYPVQYEGLEDSLNIIYLGAAPNQQVIPATDWCIQKLKRKRLFLVGCDYVFPRAANAIIRDEAKRLGVTLVGEEYLLLGDTDVGGILKKIAAASAGPHPQHHQRRLQHRIFSRAARRGLHARQAADDVVQHRRGRAVGDARHLARR